MTIREIDIYLSKHSFLIFRYQAGYYTLLKKRSLFRTQYILIATDALPQHRSSLEKLCEQVYICDDTLLGEAVEKIEVPDWQDPSWETYEAVRHCAIVHGNEIHFLYGKRDYWISHVNKGMSYLSDDLGNNQSFISCRSLFEDARIDGKKLKDIWKQVTVDGC